jgi:hypothetical protein
MAKMGKTQAPDIVKIGNPALLTPERIALQKEAAKTF